VYSLYDLIIISLSLLVVGLIVGYLSALKRAPSVQAQRKLEEHMEKLEHQQEDYQHQVTEHFSETADLLNQLTDSYRDVHNHLAKGAQLLCGEQASDQLQHMHDDETAAQLDNVSTGDIAPPLDYAPKTGPHDKGVLNEEFGLEKSKQEEANEADPSQRIAG
jgi:uncharacterized membrane-anchored protein YhcB (DUF1043 family)